jgi:hypothetical protein
VTPLPDAVLAEVLRSFQGQRQLHEDEATEGEAEASLRKRAGWVGDDDDALWPAEGSATEEELYNVLERIEAEEERKKELKRLKAEGGEPDEAGHDTCLQCPRWTVDT